MLKFNTTLTMCYNFINLEFTHYLNRNCYEENYFDDYHVVNVFFRLCPTGIAGLLIR